MKKILLTALAVSFYLCASAQTQGTTALSLGVTVNNETSKDVPGYRDAEIKTNNYTFGFGTFFKENQKIGFELGYGKNQDIYYYGDGDSNNTTVKNIGANVNYQKYFPIAKTFFAFAGGELAYTWIKKTNNQNINSNQDIKGNQYAVGANAGLTWFVSQRFAFETTLLSANAQYMKVSNKILAENDRTKVETKNFNLATEGLLNNVGFKIYLLL